MGYDWSVHESTCYRLYIDEKKSLEDIMGYMRDHHKFTPSKRAFQQQFAKWKFPSKRDPAYKNARLVARVKELWERNLPQSEMYRILTEEDGFDIRERELTKVRSKNRWLLRLPNGSLAAGSGNGGLEAPFRADEVLMDDSSIHEQLDGSLEGQDVVALGPGMVSPVDAVPMGHLGDLLGDLPNHAQGTAVHDKAEARKRKRRSRRARVAPTAPAGAATSSAPSPPPPRFPSETTIDKAREILSLDDRAYRGLRAAFVRICEESNIAKKTLAGPDAWEEAKRQLVGEVPQLQRVGAGLWTGLAADSNSDNSNSNGTKNSDGTEAKRLALEIICTDVTKRMRLAETRLTMAEAKIMLGLNPTQVRETRAALSRLLRDDSAATQAAIAGQAGPWEDLKRRWVAGSGVLRRILATQASGPAQAEKLRALEAMARDVKKRLHDGERPRERKKKPANAGPVAVGSSAARVRATTSKPPRLAPKPVPKKRTPRTPAPLPTPEASQMDVDDPMSGTAFEHVPSHVNPLQQLDMLPSAAADGTVHQLPLGGLSQATTPLQGTPDSLTQHRPPPGLLASSVLSGHQAAGLPMDPQLGQTLLLSADAQSAAAAAAAAAFVEEQYQQFAAAQAAAAQVFHHHHPATAAAPPPPPAPPAPQPSNTVAVYIRLHPSSTFVGTANLWIAMLNSPSLQELRHAATEKWPGALCLRVEGVLKDGKGTEMPLQIDEDAELAAYLAHMQGQTPTFNVQLVTGWKA